MNSLKRRFRSSTLLVLGMLPKAAFGISSIILDKAAFSSLTGAAGHAFQHCNHAVNLFDTVIYDF